MEKKGINVWMITTLVLFGGLLFVAGSFFPRKSPTPTITTTVQPTTTTAVSPTISTSPSPTIEQESDLLQLQKAFAKKYNRQASEAQVTINKKDATHISGGIVFSGDVSGGWFLAYKGADGWMIVQDGNGTVSCETIAPYNFPKSMVPECVDKNGNLVK